MKLLNLLLIASTLFFISCQGTGQKPVAAEAEVVQTETKDSVSPKPEKELDILGALVLAPQGNITAGEEYSAEIVLAAFFRNQDPQVILGQIDENGTVTGDTVQISMAAGIASFPLRDSSIGEKALQGVVRTVNRSGSGFEYYPFNQTYKVIQPMAASTATKMNIMYIGVQNPIQISAMGVEADRIQVEISNGSLKPGNREGEYLAIVSKPGEAVMDIYLKLPDGSKMQIGQQAYRVKRVPDPIAKIGGQSGGKMKAGTFKAQRGIMAVLENYDFEFKFSISGFEMTYISLLQNKITAKSNSALFDQKMLSLMKLAKPGDIFILDDIKVKGEDGTTRKLPGITFQLI